MAQPLAAFSRTYGYFRRRRVSQFRDYGIVENQCVPMVQRSRLVHGHGILRDDARI